MKKNFRCTFCLGKCKYSGKRRKHYCNNHGSVKVSYNVIYGCTEVNFYEMYTSKYRIYIDSNITMIYDNNPKGLETYLLSFPFHVGFTPDNVENKLKTMILFS